MNQFFRIKFKNTLTLVSLLMMVALVFPGANIDDQFAGDNAASVDEGLGQSNLGEESAFCDSSPSTDTTASVSVLWSYNGNSGNNNSNITNGQTTPPGAPNPTILTTFPGTQLHIVMAGTTSPNGASGTVRATVKIDGQIVFDQTASNGSSANYSYDTTLANSTVETTVVSTACNNVSTASQITYPSSPSGFDLTCGVDQVVPKGTTAFFPLHAYNMVTVWEQQPLEVDVTSSPDGVLIENLPLIYSLNHMWTADIDTSSLDPNTQYTLIFSAQNPAPQSPPPVLCYANLTVTANVPTVDLKFDGSDGPTTPTPSNGDSGELTWNTENADSCEAEMVQGTLDEWKGQQNTANEKTENFAIKGLVVDNTYEFKLTCTSGTGEKAEDTVVVSVGEPQVPTGEFYCEGDLGGGQGQDSCTISNGSSALLFWSTSYTESCSLDPVIDKYTPGTNEKKGVSTGALSTPPSSVVYTLTCTGVGGKGKYEDTVTINIQGPVLNAKCAPSPLVINQFGPPGVITVTVDVDNQGSLESVNLEGSFQNPAPASAPVISYSDNPLKVPGAGSVILTPNKDTSLGTYQFQVTASALGATSDTCFVTVFIEGEPPQPPFSAAARSDVRCESVTVTWEPPAGGPTPQGYQVFRSLTDNLDDFYAVGGMVDDTGAKEYSADDDNPWQIGVTNYYGVKSVIGTQYSSLIRAGGVVPSDCSPSLGQSDKDLYGVDNNFSDPTKCNNTSDAFNLPNSGIFRAGAKVWFRINVCNSGSEALTGIVVSEVGWLNLDKDSIKYEGDEQSKECVVDGTNLDKITLKDLPGKANLSDPATICTFSISATLKYPENTGTQLYRFWNQALITSNELPPKVVSTPQYLYSRGGKDAVPVRGENNR